VRELDFEAALLLVRRIPVHLVGVVFDADDELSARFRALIDDYVATKYPRKESAQSVPA